MRARDQEEVNQKEQRSHSHSSLVIFKLYFEIITVH
jgi:hypothetical protein